MDYSGAHSVISAALLFTPGFICISCTMYMFFTFITVPSSRSPFTAIVLARSISHFGDSLLYGVYFPLKILLGNIGISWSSSYIDGAVVTFWSVLMPTEFLLALNRMAAINLPAKYSIIFSMKNTVIMLLVSWSLAIFAYVAHIGCWVEFDYKTFELAYPDERCANLDRVGSNYFVFPSLLISLLMALTAFCQIIYRSRKNGGLKNHRQWLLFAQAPTQILCWALATSLWVSDTRNWAPDRLWKLLTVMLPQVVSHCLESVVILFFYFVYRRQSA